MERSVTEADIQIWTAWILDSHGEAVVTALAAVAAGGGQALALKSDVTVWAWGANDSGQLGIGSIDPTGVATPTQVLFPAGTTIVRIGAGNLHSMAIDSQGNVWVWGNDLTGALGTGVANQNQSTPVKITLAGSCPGPPPPPTLPTVTSLSPSYGPSAGGTLVTITGTAQAEETAHAPGDAGQCAARARRG